MTWTSRLIDDTQKEEFNEFIAKSPKGHIMQSYQWGEVKALTDWKPFRLIVEKDHEIVAAISLLKRAIPRINKSIFYAPRGPILDFGDQELFAYLLQQVKQLAIKENVIFLKIDPDLLASDGDLTRLLKQNGFVTAEKSGNFEGLQPKFVFRLNIKPTEDELLASFHHKTRYNIRLASRRGVEISTDCTKDDLKTFYDILQVTASRDEFLIRAFPYYEIIWEQLVKDGLAKLFMAYHQGKPIAGTLAFTMGDKAWYIYGASSNEQRNLMPNYLLQWTMIKWAKDLGCTLYDFRGVPGNLSEDNPIYGLYRFKKGFNPDYTEFIGEFDLVYSPFYYRLWGIAEPVYSKAIRKLIGLKKKLRGKNDG